jgi:hypothetical protein
MSGNRERADLAHRDAMHTSDRETTIAIRLFSTHGSHQQG